MTKITFKQPDDFHAHLRTGPMLSKMTRHSDTFGKVLAMGNLSPPIATARDARRYQMEILRNRPGFIPIMSIMLVNGTTPKMIVDARKAGIRVLKLIPGCTSTGSDDGVRLEDLGRYYQVLKIAEDLGMIFSVHWERLKNSLTGEEFPEEKREEEALVFLAMTIRSFPRLRIIAEHISSYAMADFIKRSPGNVAATITAHHVGPYEFSDVIKSGEVASPHIYCKPILKERRDIEAVTEMMLSGVPKFFFGSDSAPHPPEKKMLPPYAAGIFSPGAVSLPHIWSIFHKHGRSAGDFENFVSRFGCRFYGLPENEGKTTLVRENWSVPDNFDGIVPFLAGRTLEWRVKL